MLGRVSLWGKVVEHDQGWRAEFAYPAEWFVPSRRLHGPAVPGLDHLADALTVYAVPLSLLEPGARGPLARELAATPD